MSGMKRGSSGSSRSGSGKKIKVGASMATRVKQEPDSTPSIVSTSVSTKHAVREKFLEILSRPKYKNGAPNKEVQKEFGPVEEKSLLVQVINDLSSEARIQMNNNLATNDLFYKLVDETVAAKYVGLDVHAKVVLQCIEKAGNRGIWTKDIRMQTNIQQQALNKIFRQLEQRELIKPVKSVAAKNKKLYMLYDLTPSKELTGGVWYSGLEFDHEFISELRTFVMHCTKRLNKGEGVTLFEILSKMEEAKVSRVKLSLDEVRQLVQTLVFDYMVEEGSTNSKGETRYVAARKVTTPLSHFKWWDCLSPDFHFRAVKFEDGVLLSAQEPHHHTA